jgi:hypothetical protein
MKKAFAAMMVLAGGLMAAPRVAVGIGFGVPAPVAVVRPVCPGPGYNWVNGYYGPAGVWVGGYWAPPAFRVAPRAVVPVYPRYERARVAPRYEHFRR